MFSGVMYLLMAAACGAACRTGSLSQPPAAVALATASAAASTMAFPFPDRHATFSLRAASASAFSGNARAKRSRAISDMSGAIEASESITALLALILDATSELLLGATTPAKLVVVDVDVSLCMRTTLRCCTVCGRRPSCSAALWPTRPSTAAARYFMLCVDREKLSERRVWEASSGIPRVFSEHAGIILVVGNCGTETEGVRHRSTP